MVLEIESDRMEVQRVKDIIVEVLEKKYGNINRELLNVFENQAKTIADQRETKKLLCVRVYRNEKEKTTFTIRMFVYVEKIIEEVRELAEELEIKLDDKKLLHSSVVIVKDW